MGDRGTKPIKLFYESMFMASPKQKIDITRRSIFSPGKTAAQERLIHGSMFVHGNTFV